MSSIFNCLSHAYDFSVFFSLIFLQNKQRIYLLLVNKKRNIKNRQTAALAKKILFKIVFEYNYKR